MLLKWLCDFEYGLYICDVILSVVLIIKYWELFYSFYHLCVLLNFMQIRYAVPKGILYYAGYFIRLSCLWFIYRFLRKTSWQFIGWNAQNAYKEVWSSIWAKFAVVLWPFPWPASVLQNWLCRSFRRFRHILWNTVPASVCPVQHTVCIWRGVWGLCGWKHKGHCSVWWYSTSAFIKSQALVPCSPNVCSCTCIWSWRRHGYDEKGMKDSFCFLYVSIIY